MSVDESYYAIMLTNDSNYNTLSGNTLSHNNNGSSGSGYGIRINSASEDENTVVGNTMYGNDTDWSDAGTNTYEASNNRI